MKVDFDSPGQDVVVIVEAYELLHVHRQHDHGECSAGFRENQIFFTQSRTAVLGPVNTCMVVATEAIFSQDKAAGVQAINVRQHYGFAQTAMLDPDRNGDGQAPVARGNQFGLSGPIDEDAGHAAASSTSSAAGFLAFPGFGILFLL